MRRDLSRSRSGAILLVVVAFLALGMSVGIAFVFYASQQAVSMRIYREAAQRNIILADDSPPGASDIANTALAQLIYDVPDDETGIWSGIRGSSLSRAMYGLYYDGTPQTPNNANNNVPYNGIGRYRSDGSYSPPLLSGVSDGDLRAVNYTFWSGDGFLRDPERVGFRSDPKAQSWIVGAANSTNNYFPLNAPYTYPDEKDLALAAIRASDGRLLASSFYRPSTFGPLAPGNPNWTNAVGKYLLQRPRPSDMGPGFPAVPANPDGTYTGDVEQLEGKPTRQNDSLWMDLDLPVRMWRGRYYKPLVAFLVLDLDGRINVNVAGNRRGIANRHASNQGWGAWEMDLQRVFQFNEANKLFLDPNGRYGSDQIPNLPFSPDGSAIGTNAVAVGVPGPFYSRVDFDASILTNGGPQVRMKLAQAPSTRTSPNYPPRYAGSSLAERTDHPLLFNPYLLSSMASFSSGPRDRTFGPGEMQWLNTKLNNGDLNYGQSELGRLLPLNLGRSCTPGRNGWPASAVNPRFLMTTISNDLDRPGLSPWLFNAPSNYTMAQPPAVSGVFPPAPPPSSAGVAFPGLNQRTAAISPSTNVNDFDPTTWKAVQAVLGSIDLARPVADYRVDATQPYEKPGNVTAASACRALADRQRFAKDIFNRLCYATGAQTQGAVTDSPAFNALRYLAQLAVNVVDFLDSDDYITPFVWNPISPNDPQNIANFTAANLPSRVVFGTELPRLVINEACIRVENGSPLPGLPDTDPGLVISLSNLIPQATFYNVKVWAELHNPLTPGTASTVALAYRGGTPLTFGGNQVYRMLLTAPNARLRHVANVKGDPDGTIRQTVNLPAGVYLGDGIIPPSNGAYIQPCGPTSSLYVVGSEAMPGDFVMPSALTDSMKFRIPPTNFNGGDAARTTLLLQRLACPHLPPSASNPYITTDVMEFSKNMLADARLFDNNGQIMPPPLKIARQCSWGRMQPYSGNPSQVVAQQIIPAPASGLSHTFFRHNGQGNLLSNAGVTLTQPFDWLVHLDRSPISPVELLDICAYKPHELTQQFVTGPSSSEKKFQHLADWSSNGSRLHRALALLETRSLTVGMGTGGRIPGRVNVNTIWDEAVFQSVCDADGSNSFTTNDVTAIWNKLLNNRTPSGSPSTAANQDRPFWSVATPIDPGASIQFPAGIGINQTLLRSDPAKAGARLLDVPNQTHPYLRHELLNKIHGNLTTRSNSFAVWMTIGYFEVTDRQTRPVKLGRELGSNDGTSIRNRFFSIVDRTNLSIDPANPRLQGPRPVFFSYEPVLASSAGDLATPGTVTAMIPAQSFDGTVLRGTYDDAVWELRSNDPLLIDVGVHQESVTVQIVNFVPGVGATIRLTCGRPHSRGCPLMIGNTQMGNPGPQPGFNARDPRYSGVVRAFASLD